MQTFLTSFPLLILAGLFLCALFALSKSADALTEQAILISKIMKIPEVLIGATIVSIGTTLPELATSSAAVLNHSTDLALGNSLGSIITNTSLILGVGILYGSIPITRESIKNVWFLFSTIALVYALLIGQFLSDNQLYIPKSIGWLLFILLPCYLWLSFKQRPGVTHSISQQKTPESTVNLLKPIFKMFAFAAIVAISSTLLVACVQVSAEKMGISEAIISATVVALGTSVPELSTMIVAAKKGHGGLALGNIIGASLMNILLVLSTTIILSRKTIVVPLSFMGLHFPIEFLILSLLLYSLLRSNNQYFSKKTGLIFIAIYFIYLICNLLFL